MACKLWTEQEVDFLIENYSKYGAEHCATSLNRTKNSVVQKAHRLEITTSNTWAEQELDFLRKNYHQHGAAQCAASLGRTVTAVHQMASKLRIPGNANVLKTTQEYKLQLPEGCILLEHYINNRTPILHSHSVCNHRWRASPSDILRGTRCPKCAGNQLKSTEEYKSQLSEDYTLLEPYVSSHVHILHRHNICNHEWLVTPSRRIGVSQMCRVRI